MSCDLKKLKPLRCNLVLKSPRAARRGGRLWASASQWAEALRRVPDPSVTGSESPCKFPARQPQGPDGGQGQVVVVRPDPL